MKTRRILTCRFVTEPSNRRTRVYKKLMRGIESGRAHVSLSPSKYPHAQVDGSSVGALENSTTQKVKKKFFFLKPTAAEREPRALDAERGDTPGRMGARLLPLQALPTAVSYLPCRLVVHSWAPVLLLLYTIRVTTTTTTTTPRYSSRRKDGRSCADSILIVVGSSRSRDTARFTFPRLAILSVGGMCKYPIDFYLTLLSPPLLRRLCWREDKRWAMGEFDNPRLSLFFFFHVHRHFSFACLPDEEAYYVGRYRNDEKKKHWGLAEFCGARN